MITGERFVTGLDITSTHTCAVVLSESATVVIAAWIVSAASTADRVADDSLPAAAAGKNATTPSPT